MTMFTGMFPSLTRLALAEATSIQEWTVQYGDEFVERVMKRYHESPYTLRQCYLFELRLLPDQQANIECPRCGSISYHPEDIRQGYCGRCHWWTSDETLGAYPAP